MPSVIQLTAGDTIVLRNDDTAPHMILYALLPPGQTQTRTLTTPGSEVYSSGCGVHAASFMNFTTIFVSEQV
jgi:plastocyanin